MTSVNIEQRQALMLQHPAMLFAYIIDPDGRYFGYLPRTEVINLNPYQPEVKVYQRSDKQGAIRLRPVKLQHIEDIRLANRNDYETSWADYPTNKLY